MIPKFAPLAAWEIIALLIAAYPANIYMVMNTESFPHISSIALYLQAAAAISIYRVGVLVYAAQIVKINFV